MPSMESIARGRIAALTLAFCATPYVGLRLYLALEMHEVAATAAIPDTWILSGLFLLGVLMPTFGVVWILRRVLKDRLQFQLGGLLQVYLTLVLLFASSFAIAQASSIEPSFSGMPILWTIDEPVDLQVHVTRLHDIFLDSLYLSVITITTVGYGDLVPMSYLARFLTAVEGLAGIGFVGIALGHYFSVCLHPRTSDRRSR